MKQAVEMRILYPEEQIAAEVHKLARKISADYEGRKLLVVVVLKGAFIFAADLIRGLTIPVEIDFVQLSSYSGQSTSGSVSLVKDISLSVAGRDVLVVEDIVDTGLTLEFLIRTLQQRGALSLKICTLIDKPERRQVFSIFPDYVGINCQRGFLIGYGLDLDERWRGLPAIYELINNPPDGGLHDSPM